MATIEERLKIVIESAYKEKGARKAIDSLGGIKRVLGTLGLAFGAKEALELGAALEEAGRQSKDARNALVQHVRSLEAYNEVIAKVREQTRGQIDETSAAQASLVLLKSEVAANADENARILVAGNALVNAYQAQGASMELLIRLLNSGNRILLDNFNITQEQVNAMKTQVEATTNLAGQEARLQAIKQIVIQEGERLEQTISDETVAANQLKAATADLASTIGEGLTPAVSEGKNVLTAMILSLTEAVDAMNDVDVATSSASRRAALYQQIITGATEKATGYAQALNATSFEAQLAAETQARLNAMMGAGQEAIDAQADRLQGLANAYRTNAQLVDEFRQLEEIRQRSARTDPSLIQQRDDLEEMGKAFEKQQEAAEKSARGMSQAFEQGASRLENAISNVVQPTLAKVFDPETGDEHLDENARRLAAVYSGALKGGLDENFARLKEEMGGADFLAGVFAAGEAGDLGKLAEEANRVLMDPLSRAKLFDVDRAAEIVRQQMIEQNARELMMQAVREQLQAEGAGEPIDVLGFAVGNTQEGMDKLSQTTAGLGDISDTASGKIKKGFGEDTLKNIETMNERLKFMLALVQGIGEAALLAQQNLSGMNVPPTGAGGNGNGAPGVESMVPPGNL